MWKCVNCNEDHGDDFDICWNCGTDIRGKPDPDFVVEGTPADTSEADDPSCELTIEHLPDMTYYSLPFYLLLYPLALTQFQQAFTPADLASAPFPSLLPVAACVVAQLFVAIPIFLVVLRLGFFSLIRRAPVPKPKNVFLVILKLLRLPPHISQHHSWFSPVYYGSFAIYFLSPLALLLTIE